MQNQFRYLVFLLFGALVGCGTHASQLSSYERQLLRGASTAADRILRSDEISVVVTNNTVPADANFISKLILEKSKTTNTELRQQLDQAINSYILTARKYCNDKGRQSGSREVIGQNTTRFTCFTYPEFAFQQLESMNSMCNLMETSRQRNGLDSNVNDTPYPGGCNESWSSGACQELKRIFQGVERPTCGFVRKRMAEYQVAPVQPSAPAVKNNDLEPAKKKCRELGFTENTEKFGSCVLSLSN
jgi:hypothetical protein